MKESKMEANLYCIQCRDETPHVIFYINNRIKNVECEECHRIQGIKIDIMKEFYKEIYERISTKPARITQEYKQDLNKFLLKLPARAISKPYRLIRDLNNSRKVIKQFKN
ncbi:bh protein [Priestia endophytica]|uniref:bh protein n=1 Tax=Priestia endophytica TaxID=135735 RepID=UPI000DCA81AF|nr:bh protein [Priestia endophytica]RAS80774.1 bh protein [Priestia endophytica]